MANLAVTPDDEQVLAQRWVEERDGAKAAALHLVRHRRGQHQGNTEASHERPLDRHCPGLPVGWQRDQDKVAPSERLRIQDEVEASWRACCAVVDDALWHCPCSCQEQYR